jgi:hypothetical protein
MYHFAVVALLALAVLKVADLLCDLVPVLDRFRSLLTLVLAVVAVVALDYSLFAGWGIGIRDAVLGTWVTAFVVWGATVPWRAIFGWLTHTRAGNDTVGERSDPIAKAA